MPFFVEHLLEGRPEPITAQPDERVRDAVERMVEYDYSQLPVVDIHGMPIGLITSDSIMRALNNFTTTTDKLRVYDAMVQIEEKQQFRADDDLFLMLDDLRDSYAVLIIDRNRKLIGVVTTYDTTEYFRRRAEDMMLAREIETLIKDYILAAFKGPDGVIDEVARDTAIKDITPSNSDLLKSFKKAVKQYLDKSNGSGQLDGQSLDAAFQQHLNVQQPIKKFDELSLNQYIDMFLHDSRWSRYSSVFQVNRDSIRTLLHAVRDTRNNLAHLREDITAQERHALQFCAKWLARHETALNAAFHPTQPEIHPIVGHDVMLDPTLLLPNDSSELTPPEEAVDAKRSRYTPLALYLQHQPLGIKHIQLSFAEIERIMQDRLPESAHSQRQFWANDTVSHTHSQEWLEAGWRVSNIHLSNQQITFTRVKGYDQAAITFFSQLLADLRTVGNIPLLNNSPQGWHWHGLIRVPATGGSIGTIGFAFALGLRARVELFIDTGDYQRNKLLFDNLKAYSSVIEASYGGTLTWERLDQKRASRIASYHRGAIGDKPEQLANLRNWAVDAISRLYPILEDHVDAVLRSLNVPAQAQPNITDHTAP